MSPEDAKTTGVIWGPSILKKKGSTVRRNAKRLVQSVIKVPKELLKLQQDVELAIDCFLSKNTFFSYPQHKNVLHDGDTCCLTSHRVYIGSSPFDVLGTTNTLEWVHTTNKHQSDLLCACMHRNQHC